MDPVQLVRSGVAEQSAAKLRKAGAQFEAVLLNNVLGAVERAFTELPGGHRAFSNDAFNGLAMQGLTSALSERGGIGLGKRIEKALARRSSGQK